MYSNLLFYLFDLDYIVSNTLDSVIPKVNDSLGAKY